LDSDDRAHGTADQLPAAARCLKVLPNCSSLQELSEHVWSSQQALRDYLDRRYSSRNAVRSLADSGVLQLILARLSRGLQLLAEAGSATALPDRQSGALILLAAPSACIMTEAVTLLKAEGASKVGAAMENSGEPACAATQQAVPNLRPS
jgi:hypothetical protein